MKVWIGFRWLRTEFNLSRLALRPTQPSVQWVPGVLSPGVKRGRVVTLTTHSHLMPRSRMSRSYASSPLGACESLRGSFTFYFEKVRYHDQFHIVSPYLLLFILISSQYTPRFHKWYVPFRFSTKCVSVFVFSTYEYVLYAPSITSYFIYSR
jgi:hypothetical protein